MVFNGTSKIATRAYAFVAFFCANILRFCRFSQTQKIDNKENQQVDLTPRRGGGAFQNNPNVWLLNDNTIEYQRLWH